MAEQQFEYDVFLSHASADKPAVLELADRLKADGLRVWLDDWVIQLGDMVSLKIEQGLESSRTLVLVMSQAAFDSEWVTLERHTALFRDPTNQQRRFIPLRLDDCEIKDSLKQFAYIDWQNKSDDKYERLFEAIRNPSNPPRKSSQKTPDATSHLATNQNLGACHRSLYFYNLSQFVGDLLFYAECPASGPLSEDWAYEKRQEVNRLTRFGKHAKDEQILNHARYLVRKLVAVLTDNPELSEKRVNQWPIEVWREWYQELCRLNEYFIREAEKM